MYLGIDIGSISTKGVVIDKDNNILASGYILTEGNPVAAVTKLLQNIKNQLSGDVKIISAGTTGSARRLIGSMINAGTVKNEITAHAIGTLSIFPDVRTIFEIGGQDSKIILIENGVVTDYAMNTLCAAGTGAFLSSQARRLGFPVEEFAELALKSQKETNIASRCTVFAESDLVHKLQTGHKKEDIAAGLCKAVATNYLNNLCKGKKITPPIVFQGGVSKNAGVVRAFEKQLNQKILTDERGHLTGALGVAIISKSKPQEKEFNFDIIENKYDTKGSECLRCANNCEIVGFYRDNQIIDAFGSRCEAGLEFFIDTNKRY